MSILHCPTCGNDFDPDDSGAMPFCCERCRQIDLGRWLREVQRIPSFSDPEDDELPPDEEPAE